MLTYLEDNLLFVLAVVIVILFALIAGGILFLCYKWRQEEIDEEAARRVVLSVT